MSKRDERPDKGTALVTGASAGIGRAFAERLAGEGWNLIIVARSRERLEKLAHSLARKHHVRAEPLAADLTDPVELRAVEGVIDGEDIELLVNNAGFGTVGSFARLALDQEEEEIRLNVVALVRLTRAALPGMIERGRGAIINVSSLAAFQPGPFNATYAATKAFVNSFTEAIAEEARGTGVRLQALCPGFTRTEFQKRAGVGTEDFPDFVWMEAAAVVASSLAALGRGDVVHIPGLGNQLVSTVTGLFPRALTRRVSGTIMRRFQT